MSLTQSLMNPLGFVAPAFTLPDTVSGTALSRDDCRGERGLLVCFICNHCPYVKHLADALAAIGRDYRHSAIGVAAISANDVISHPQDGPVHMAAFARERGFSFPYLYDESQQVARAYGAECTPDFFLFDAKLACVYRGRFDASRPGNGEPVTGAELRAAIDALLAGNAIDPQQHASIGCNIKWRA